MTDFYYPRTCSLTFRLQAFRECSQPHHAKTGTTTGMVAVFSVKDDDGDCSLSIGPRICNTRIQTAFFIHMLKGMAGTDVVQHHYRYDAVHGPHRDCFCATDKYIIFSKFTLRNFMLEDKIEIYSTGTQSVTPEWYDFNDDPAENPRIFSRNRRPTFELSQQLLLQSSAELSARSLVSENAFPADASGTNGQEPIVFRVAWKCEESRFQMHKKLRFPRRPRPVWHDENTAVCLAPGRALSEASVLTVKVVMQGVVFESDQTSLQ